MLSDAARTEGVGAVSIAGGRPRLLADFRYDEEAHAEYARERRKELVQAQLRMKLLLLLLLLLLIRNCFRTSTITI